MESKQRLAEVFAVVFGRPISAEAERKDVPEWDSLKHMQLVFAVEEQFNMQFSEEEIAALDSVARFAELIQERDAA
ncbi:MAG TPA: acyl carrier protein [Verrucomicrobiae bacterium]|jgi:acyl carrier protein